jgi:hypothetical protein
MSLMIVSQEELTEFNQATAKAAKDAQARNPVKLKPRSSKLIQSELERAKLSLNSVGTPRELRAGSEVAWKFLSLEGHRPSGSSGRRDLQTHSRYRRAHAASEDA